MPWLSIARNRWIALTALVLCVALAHLAQPMLLPWRAKFVMAIPGAVLYFVTSWALFHERRWALWVCVVAPVVGGLVIAGAGALEVLDLVHSGLRPDLGQLAVGALQIPAGFLAVSLLLWSGVQGDSATTMR